MILREDQQLLELQQIKAALERIATALEHSCQIPPDVMEYLLHQREKNQS